MASSTGAGSKIRNAKLVLLGDVGTGKSSLVLRFVKGQFVEFQESTIGAAFFSQTLAVNDETVKFEIWDTAGRSATTASRQCTTAAPLLLSSSTTSPTRPLLHVQRNGFKNFKHKEIRTQ
ncbi:hypothetical protein ACQ4PT_051957 [Festuca glaucescens]